MGKIHVNSLKCIRIEMLAEDTRAHLGWGSGSLCKFRNNVFLVTNWHIVSGRNFQTNETLHVSGAVPGFLNLEFHTVRKTEELGFHHDECVINLVELFDSSIENNLQVFNSKPLYHIHPNFGQRVDVAVINLTNIFNENREIDFISCDLDKENRKVDLSVMDEVFISGFPLDTNTTPNRYPIYKNATIASEPDAYGDLPMFYVDGKTKKGMSGSPVVRRSRFKITNDGDNGDAVAHPEKFDFIGVYSGRDRQEKDEHEAELGIVWRFTECILPIVEKAINKV